MTPHSITAEQQHIIDNLTPQQRQAITFALLSRRAAAQSQRIVGFKPGAAITDPSYINKNPQSQANSTVLPKISYQSLDHFHERAKVPGGWLVRINNGLDEQTSRSYYGNTKQIVAVVFVPDPNHTWK